jgi:hypothetical protein
VRLPAEKWVLALESAQTAQPVGPAGIPPMTTTMKTSRRHFLTLSVGVSSALMLSRLAFADTANALSEADPKAQAVGYKEEASKVDKAKFPGYAAGQTCANCSLFQGKTTDAYGGCTLFGDKQVAARGWCSSYSNM